MLIIFDCDGVLVDSEILAAKIFSEALLSVDVVMTAEQCLSNFKGKTLPDCYAWLEHHYGMSLPESFDGVLQQKTAHDFTKFLRPVKDVEKVIRFLVEKNIKYCVASNGGHKKIENSLRVTGLLPYFSYRFSAEDVFRGKPSPDLFLHAAKNMSVLPGDCIVIEDSETGKCAAKSAEMGLVWYHPEKHDDPDAYSSMAEILTVLEHKVAVS